MDWRFLMPYPPAGGAEGVPRFRRACVLGTDPERVAATVELCSSTDVAAQVLEHLPGAPHPGQADLVVALGSSWRDVRVAARQLVPGGVLYWERDGRRPSRRLLRAAGLEATTYWRRRHGDHDTLFVPLGPRLAARWYAVELADVVGPARDAVRRLVTAWAPATRMGVGLLGRRWSCVAVRGGRDLTPSILAAAFDPDTVSPEGRMLPVVLARGEGEWSRVVLLPFGDDDAQPARVVKLPRLERHAEATKDEQRLLADLAAALPVELRGSVPRALATTRWNGLPVAVETFVPGRPLAYRVRSRTDAGVEELRRATGWLASLARVAPPDPTRVPPLDEVLWAAADRCGLTVTDHALERFGHAALRGTHLPTVYEHGDLTPTNLRIADDRLTAVDWEAARPGRPLADLLYLLLHWPWPGTHAGPPLPQAFATVYLRRDGVPAETARETVAGYLHALRLPSHVVGPILANVLARQALDREARREASAEPAPGNLYADMLEQLLVAPEEVGWW